MSDLLTSDEMDQNSWIEDLVTGIINLLDSLLVSCDFFLSIFSFFFVNPDHSIRLERQRNV